MDFRRNFENKINEYFYVLKNEDVSNKEIYFLADSSVYDRFDNKKLENYNNFTDTSPIQSKFKNIFKSGWIFILSIRISLFDDY